MNLLALLLSATLLISGSPDAADCSLDPMPTCALTAQPVRSSITIDAHHDEADWQSAPVATGFRQFEPHEGAKPSQRTEVRVLYGTSDLYIAAMLYDDEPQHIMRTLGRRDEYNKADWFTASIDSYFDRKTAYQFSVSAAGTQVDGILTDRLDRSWDAVWDAAVRTTSKGWMVEMRIPYSMLRFGEGDQQTWGINFRRYIPRLSETDEWVLVRRTELSSGRVAQFGILQGLNDIQPRRNVQVTPYTLSSLRTEEGTPGELQTSRSVDVGGDIKVGLSSSTTLDMTINPDFGQVEADPAVLNLSAFETFFPERRSFFIEGVQIFDYDLDRGGSLLYTRRIGGRAPLIGATKLSGRTNDGLSFGLMGAATGKHFNPNRFYGVARLKQEIGRFSSVGGMFTGYKRSTTGDPHLRSMAGGVDWDFRLNDNAYQISGQTSLTHRATPGDPEAPETGWSLKADFDKVRGVWNVFSGFSLFDDHYNPNDLGRLRRNNYINASAGFSYQMNGGDPFGPFRRADMRIFSGHSWSYRKHLSMGYGLFFFSGWELQGFQRIRLRANTDYLFGGYDLFETRGLGPWAAPRQFGINLGYETDSRRSWQVEPGIGFGYTADGGHDYSLGLESQWNVGTRLTLSGEVEYEWENDRTAWSSNETFVPLNDGWAIGTESESPDEVIADELHPFDDGHQLDTILDPVEPFDANGRYFVPVFGTRDTRSMDVTLRSNVTFTPALSLQLYGQLFAARGQYDRFQLLQDRDTLVPFRAYPKRDAFALNSFQTNLVLRWEYRPGSTLFVVWTQSRSGDRDLHPLDVGQPSPYDTGTTDQLGDALNLFPTNVFLVKLSYKFLS